MEGASRIESGWFVPDGLGSNGPELEVDELDELDRGNHKGGRDDIEDIIPCIYRSYYIWVHCLEPSISIDFLSS